MTPLYLFLPDSWGDGLSSPSTTDYRTWLPNWIELCSKSPQTAKVPPLACNICTPLDYSAWGYFLQVEANKELTHFFLKGISQGFHVGFDYENCILQSATKNLQCAYNHPQVVEDYLHSEVTTSRVAGPFYQAIVSGIQTSRFGVIPKGHQQDKWRLIVDLSHPVHHSVNDGIPSSLSSIQYITVDDAAQKIISLGPGTQMAKIDIRSAFRLIPVHPTDRHLLGMKWKEYTFIDTCLPFGLRSAPKLFNILADLLTRVLTRQGVTFVLHYLDDFLTLGPPASNICQQNLNIIQKVCTSLGIPLALEKVEGPSTTLTFLGITLDTINMEARLSEEKLTRIRQLVTSWLNRKKATKREILSLVGLLQHATKIIRCGRTFISRMYSTAAKVKELDYYTRLNREFRSDLCWWHTFMANWNGLSLMRLQPTVLSFDASIQTDASGSWGCGAYFNGKWLQLQWSADWLSSSIMAKEMAPILLSCAVWGPDLSRKSVCFQCDNSSVVAAVNKGSAKEPTVMHLLRSLWFFVAYYNIYLIATHIPGVANLTADCLSRCQMQSFFTLNPQASKTPTPLPPSLVQIITPAGTDWTSPHFHQLFTTTINRD